MIFEVLGGFRGFKNQEKSTKIGSGTLRDAKNEAKTRQGRLREQKMGHRGRFWRPKTTVPHDEFLEFSF